MIAGLSGPDVAWRVAADGGRLGSLSASVQTREPERRPTGVWRPDAMGTSDESDESDKSLVRRSIDPSGAFYGGSMDGRTIVSPGVSLRPFDMEQSGKRSGVERSESDAGLLQKSWLLQ